ncbi:hypothetical protein NDU88_000093 [Pleurodeles waltl]|uniref:Uncharacterized protein n=1 Tax=Pleurodeles waltl TaxID=8319 RepID=A0AAV7TDZ0_PLEWA|nr:hypothetical protein NDU88_000093 [Pleurodeles waltl]
MKSCPGGMAARTDEQEVTSEPDIRVTRTEIWRGKKRKGCVPDKPEEDLWTETEERVTPGIDGGTGTCEADERETTNDDRRNPRPRNSCGRIRRSP